MWCYLRGKIGRVIEFPITEVREGRGIGVRHKIGTIGRGTVWLLLEIVGARHTGEGILIGRPAGERVGEAATPLEEESEGGEGERKDG